MTELHRIYRGGTSPRGAIIFVHGLSGDWRKTWQASEDDAESFWPSWLQDDLPDIAVHSVGYEAAVSGWRGNAMEIPDQARNMRAELEAQGLHRHPLVFICHSLGGLIVKDMMFNAALARTGSADALLKFVQAVVFIATPHSGSRLADLVSSSGWLGRRSRAIKGLETDSAPLQRLSQWYRDHAPVNDIATIVFSEDQKTKGLRVVDRASADPGLPGVMPIPIGADHIEICKPADRSATLYKATLAFLKEQFTENGERAEETGRRWQDEDRADQDADPGPASFNRSAQRSHFTEQISTVLSSSEEAMDTVAKAVDANLVTTAPSAPTDLAAILVDLTIEKATAGLRTAFRSCLEDGRIAAARIVCQVTRLVLPAIFEPDVLAAIERGRHDIKAALLPLPVTTKTVAECAMAAVDRRAARHRTPSVGEEWTGGEFELPIPPEGGPQSFGDRFESAFHEHLVNQFTDLDHRRRMPPDILQRRVASRLRASAADGKSYYYLFSLTKDESDDPDIRETVARLKQVYPSIVFIELSNDEELFLQETEHMQRVRDQLGTD